MKKIILICLLSLASTQVWAEGKVDIDITARANIYTYHYGISKGGRCGGGFEGPYANDSKDYEKRGQISTTTTDSRPLKVNTGYFGNKNGYPKSNLNLFHVNLNGTSQQKGNATVVSATIHEVVNEKSGRKDWGGGCTNNHYNEYLHNASYAGDVTLSYTVPNNVWAIEITESKTNRVFQAKNASENSRINGALFETHLKGKRLIWVTPGSELSKSFRINATANKRSPLNQYQISFTPVGKTLTASRMDEKWIQGLIQGLTKVTDKETMKAISANDYMSVIHNSFSVLRSRTEFTKALKRLSTQSLFEISQKLHLVAMGEIHAPNENMNLTIRAVTALLSYEVASLLVEDFAPFCEIQEHDLPYLGEKAMVSDLQWGVYLMSRMIRRLQVEDESMTIFSAYKGYLKELERLEAKGLNFNSIYDSKELAKNNILSNIRKELKIKFNILNASAQPQNKPISRSYQDLRDFFSVYQTVGTDDELSQQLLSEMKELTVLEHQFYPEFRNTIRQFSPDNDSPILVNHLKTQISDMDTKLAKVIDQMKKNLRLLSISEGNRSNALAQILTELRVHSLNIVKNSYADIQLDNFDFEVIRANYVDSDRAENNVQTVKQCLSTGGAK